MAKKPKAGSQSPAPGNRPVQAKSISGKVSVYFACVIAVAAVCAGLWIHARNAGRTESGQTEGAGWNWNDQARSVKIERGSIATPPTPIVEPQARVLSTSPRAYIFDNLLTDAECDFLIGLVESRLKPAGVVLQTEDKYALSTEYRNNEQVWLTQKEEDQIPMLSTMLKRIHRVAHIPMGDAEGLQVGRYLPGQKYEAHVDTDPSHDVARPATLLMYLKDVEGGGDTVFPGKNKTNCMATWHKAPDGIAKFGCANCCDHDFGSTMRVKPKKGRGILFFSHDVTGRIDNMAEHAACPVKEGSKWVAQRWFRYVPYQRNHFPKDRRFDGLPKEAGGEGPWNGNIHVLHDEAPRIYLLEKFLTAEECAHMIGLARNASAGSGYSIPEQVEKDDATVAAIAKRLHRAAYMPEPNAQELHVVNHGAASTVELHSDSDKSGRSPATITMFLNDADGGDIVFPLGQCTSIAECCRQRKIIRVPPRAGRAILHFSVTAELKYEPGSIYGACSVKSGEKWTLQRIFRNSRTLRLKHKRDPLHDFVAVNHVKTVH